VSSTVLDRFAIAWVGAAVVVDASGAVKVIGIVLLALSVALDVARLVAKRGAPGGGYASPWWERLLGALVGGAIGAGIALTAGLHHDAAFAALFPPVMLAEHAVELAWQARRART
jgi:hypothetical protein